MKGLQLSAYGDPAEVIELIDLPELGPLAPDEYIIDVEAAPIEPTDQYIVAGIYGELPPLPHLLGCEGALPRLVRLDAVDPCVVFEHRRQHAITDLHVIHVATDCRYAADALAS